MWEESVLLPHCREVVLEREQFQEALLRIMESKQHWGWPLMTAGLARRDRLHIHFEQEFATFVRDFPVLVARAYVRCPIPEVRRELIENVYEEETGNLVAGAPHPQLFLEYPRGLGMDLSRFENIALLPSAQLFRDALDDFTLRHTWGVAAAVTTLFLEGTSHERGELEPSAAKRPAPPLEQHPLVLHYGLPLSHLQLTRAHRSVEGDHRKSAWRVLLDYVPAGEHEQVLAAMRATCDAWLGYRDEISTRIGLQRPV